MTIESTVNDTAVEVPLELLESGIHEMEELDPVKDFSLFVYKWRRWITIAFQVARRQKGLKKKA